MKTFIALMILACSFSTWATLQVFPTRIIFDDKERVTTISIRNKGNVEETYTLRTVFFRMNPSGAMELVEEPTKEERPLLDYVRFSPRQMTLKPNEEQVVRLMLKNTAPLESGDYRAHLRILPDDAPPATQTASSSNVSMQLVAKVAISISMFYYKGDIKLEAALSNFQIEKDPVNPEQVKFKITITNKGKSFLIGNLKLFQVNSSGEEKQIGFLDGIYSYIPERNLEYSFSPSEKIDSKKGNIRLKFFGPTNLGEPLIATIDGIFK